MNGSVREQIRREFKQKAFGLLTFAMFFCSTNIKAAEALSPTFKNLTVLPTSSYWTTNTPSSNILRAPDRMFLGKISNQYQGDYSDYAETWISSAMYAGGQYAYLERNAQFLNISTFGEPAQFNAVRSSDNAQVPPFPVGQECCAIATSVLGVNDNTDRPQSVWGYYGTLLRLPSTGNVGNEIDVFNAVPVQHGVDPYNGTNAAIGNGTTYGYALQCGGEASGHTTHNSPCDAGLYIGPNGSKWDKGIVIHQGLSAAYAGGNDGSISASVFPIAIEMGTPAGLRWLNTSYAPVAFVNNSNTTTDKGSGLNFTQFGALFQDPTLAYTFVQINYVANSVNYPVLSGSASGGDAVTYGASGSDRNSILSCNPKGTASSRHEGR